MVGAELKVALREALT